MSDNLHIWNTLGKTDPEHTKQFQRAGGFRGTAIKPIYTEMKMTELFGPCGIGWGYSEPQFQIVNGPEGEVAVYCWLSLWHRNADTGELSSPIPGVGGDFVVSKNKYGLKVDDEAFKKAATDALGNAMKHLGMSADVHMGRFDDNKYVAERRSEEADRQEPAKRTMKEISAAKKGREDVHDTFIAELEEVTTPFALERFEKAWADKLSGDGGHVWTMQERLEKRRAEINAVVDDEPAADVFAAPTTRAEFIMTCHDKIAAAINADVLLTWWNGDRLARTRFSLTPAEVSDLKARVMERRDELKAAPAVVMRPYSVEA